MADLKDLIQSRLDAAEQWREEAPKRKAEAQARYLEEQRERRLKADKLTYDAIMNAPVLDFTFTFGIAPDSDDMEYIGVHNEHVGNFAIVRSWKRYDFDTMRRLQQWAGAFSRRLRIITRKPTKDACIQRMLESQRVDYLAGY